MDLFYFLAIVVIGLLVLIPVNLKLFRKSAQSQQPDKPAEESASPSRVNNLTDGYAPETAGPHGEVPSANGGAEAAPNLTEADRAGTHRESLEEHRAPEQTVPGASSREPDPAPARPGTAAASAPAPVEQEEARFAPAAEEMAPPAQPEAEPELPPRSQRHAGHTHGRKASLRGSSIRPAAQTPRAEAPLPPHEAAEPSAAGALSADTAGTSAAESAAASTEEAPRLQLHPFADRKRRSEAPHAEGAASLRADETPAERPTPSAPAAAAGGTPAADRAPSGVPVPHAAEMGASAHESPAARSGSAGEDGGVHSDMDYREALRRGLRPEPEPENVPEPRKDEKYDDRKYRDTLRDMFREAAKNAENGNTDNRK
ncbi:hypothetical protein [Paenibacillus sp. GbtcB18]|uniref:hypothetical protein n=1 Tax=Paenibacillus sp. GbtcB18 TaxID=2824763 RepID=UPI001C2F0FAB|nr:hypothetical protein [Paenibacillus sp. GbtcB18]